MGVVELGLGIELGGKSRADLSKRGLLAVSDGNGLELGGTGDDVEETANLGLGRESLAEQLDGAVVDVVVGGDHAQIDGRHVNVVLDADALGVLEVAESGLDQLGQVVRQMAMGHALQLVVVGVLGHAAVHERPGQVVHGVLLVLDGLGDHLGVEVVVQTLVQVRLHRQRLVQELLVEGLPRRLTHDHHLGVGVGGRAVGPAAHLQHVADRVVLVGVLLAVVVLRVHDHGQVALELELPAQAAAHHHHLDGARREELGHDSLVQLTRALVQIGHAVDDRLLQRLVLHLLQDRLELFLVHVQELARLDHVRVGRGRVGHDIQAS